MPDRLPSVAIIVPILNEISLLKDLLAALPGQDAVNELIMVDGGSDDGSRELLEQFVKQHGQGEIRIRLVNCTRAGRAFQMNQGAAIALSNVLVFLHADTIIPRGSIRSVQHEVVQGAYWGWFRVRLTGNRLIYRLIGVLMNLRSRLTGIGTGDQVFYVRQDVFQMLGGFPDIALMEDIQFATSLGRVCAPRIIVNPVTTSSRRWQQQGIFRTIFRMWFLRLAHWLGVSPRRLAAWYQSDKSC